MIDFRFSIIFKTDKRENIATIISHLASQALMVTDGYQLILCGSVKWQVLPNEGEKTSEKIS